MKTCTGECGRTLSLEAFGFDSRRPDGRQARCRECDAAAVRRRRAAKPSAQAAAKQRQEMADLAVQRLKRCARRDCRKVLPLESFSRSSRTADGRYAYCRECCKAIDAARRPKLPWVPPTYSGVHQRMPSLEGRACWQCGDPAEQWAYDHDDPNELVSEKGLPYSLDQARYKPMCRPCHGRFDLEHRRETGTARPRGPRRASKPCAFCGAGFWNPSHHRKTCSPECETELRRRSRKAYEERVLSTTGLSSSEIRNQAKLTPEAVRDIRSRHADRSASANELASLYGIHLSTVFSVVSRDTWRHVA